MVVLGLTSAGRARHILEDAFEATTYPGWLNFTLAGATDAESNCKLYVSPRIESLAEVFPIVAKVFTRMEVRSFKVGRRLDGLLRPDKIVAYFDDRPHLDAVATELERELAGCPAQGVPFTTGIDADGLLSWGTDPPLGSEVLSWRSWVTKVLAAELLKVKAAARGDVVSDLLHGVARLGIDPARWTVDGGAFSTVRLS